MTRSVFVRQMCLSVDVQAYSSRDDTRQFDVQKLLGDVLDRAAAAAGVHRKSWETQNKGDEELAVIPAGQPERAVVQDFARELGTVLYQHNCDLPHQRRLRLRLAVEYGLVAPAAYGFAGSAVIAVSRLVNTAAAKQALRAAPEANLATVLSNRVYTELVLGGHTSLAPELFRRVMVCEKEFSEPAWLRVHGADVHQLPLDDADPATEHTGATAMPGGTSMHATASNGATVNQVAGDMHTTSRPNDSDRPAGQSTTTVFTGPIDATGATIGIRNG